MSTNRTWKEKQSRGIKTWTKNKIERLRLKKKKMKKNEVEKLGLERKMNTKIYCSTLGNHDNNVVMHYMLISEKRRMLNEKSYNCKRWAHIKRTVCQQAQHSS